MKKTPTEYPLLALRGLVVFPKSSISFDIARPKSVTALETALTNNKEIFAVSQLDAENEEVSQSNLCKVGTICKVTQVFRQPNGRIRVIVEGIKRAYLKEYIDSGEMVTCTIDEFEEFQVPRLSMELTALLRATQELFEEYAGYLAKLPADVIFEILTFSSNVGRLADLIGIHSLIKYDEKQRILEQPDEIQRLSVVNEILSREIELLKMQKEILEKVKTNMDKVQKDYYLREQLKVIQEELGEKDGLAQDVREYRQRAENMELSEEATKKLNKELKRLERIQAMAPESGGIRDYVEHILNVPWNKFTKENKNLKNAREVLDKDHYGLEKVKERMVEFLAVCQTAPKQNAPIICLVGPPGVGKTSIAKSVAKALGRKYVRISLGGVRDEADIRGHRKTYIGAMPGRILYAMQQAGYSNPLVLLDEIDKMGNDFKGNPAAALLEVLDAEQNHAFRDHYLEVPYDLSNCMFLCTANTTEGIPPALIDRLEIIKLESYTDNEKINIAKKFLLPKQLERHGITKSDLKIKESAIEAIVSDYTKEAGVRRLERHLGELCRKSVKAKLLNEVIGEKKKAVTITSENIELFLGNKKVKADKIFKEPQVGICRGLAWTSLGGDTLSIEVNSMTGRGNFELTGNVGDVMKESAKAAMSYIRANYEKFGLSQNFYRVNDIHIHIPEGAVPKDGPSAGITIATAMVSALTNVPVKNNIAMTGEITIRGRVLPIGGLKEKILAAKKAGVVKVIIPNDNADDLNELDEYVKKDIEIILAKDMDKVLDCSLAKTKE